MQTNVQPGEKVFLADADYEGYEGRLVKIKQSPSGDTKVALPSTTMDYVVFVLTDCNKGSGANVSCLPLAGSHNVRVRLTGNCTIGAPLYLAPTSSLGTAGCVQSQPTESGNYRMVGIAEEKGVDGQLVLMRPFNDVITVTE